VKRCSTKDACIDRAIGDVVTRLSTENALDVVATNDELAALAQFRFALRRFLAFSERAAAELGLTMQWYQALLVIKTSGGGNPISVGELAEQLMIKDNSAAELVSRLASARLVKRKTDPTDRRRSLILLTPLGDSSLARLASAHLARLRENRNAFVDLFHMCET
jgi:DNA-binding MarR family transcriptional regulator